MTLRELCTIRESCRNFDPDRPVPQELLKQIAETAILAPTARNEQSWHFYLCTGETAKEVAKCTHLFPGVNAFTDNCPAFIVISSEEK